jgi:hypothetical protein
VSESPKNTERRHAEEPAEGGTGGPAEVLSERQHAEEPAEGADSSGADPSLPVDGGPLIAESQRPKSDQRENS